LLKPATPKDILVILGNLRLHFNTNLMNQKEFELLLTDYIEELAIYPIDLIYEACRTYRKDPQSVFFPKLGQLLGLMSDKCYKRRWELQKLYKLLEVSEDELV